MNKTSPLKLVVKNSNEQSKQLKTRSIAQEKVLKKSDFENLNDFVILVKLTTDGPHTRSELVKVTKLPRTTIYDALSRLILDGYVKKYSEKSGGRGRPKVYFESLVEIED